MWVDKAGMYWRQRGQTWEYLGNGRWLPGAPGSGLRQLDDAAPVTEGVVVRTVIAGEEDVIRLGPQGDTGATGPTGPIGPQGPQGESIPLFVTTAVDYTIALPEDPVDRQMVIVEVRAQAPLTVRIPDGAVLTMFTRDAYALRGDTTGFFGFRYSASASTWFLMSATMQV